MLTSTRPAGVIVNSITPLMNTTLAERDLGGLSGAASSRGRDADRELLDGLGGREVDVDPLRVVRPGEDPLVDRPPGVVDPNRDRRVELHEGSEADELRAALGVDREGPAAEVDDADLALRHQQADRVGVDVAVREAVRAVPDEQLDVPRSVDGGPGQRASGHVLDREITV